MREIKLIEKLDSWCLDTGETGYYDSREGNMKDIKITENNMRLIVEKINEIVDLINKTKKEADELRIKELDEI